MIDLLSGVVTLIYNDSVSLCTGSSSLMMISLTAINTPPYPSERSFLYTEYCGGNISELNMSGLNHVSVPNIISGFEVSIMFSNSSFLFLIL